MTQIKQRTDILAVNEDVRNILTDTIAQYEKATGKTLQPAHIERLLINIYAYRETLTRQAINEAFRQTFPQTATGLALDLCGETLGCHRLQNKPARTILRFSVTGDHGSIVIAKGTQVAASDDVVFVTMHDDVITPLINYVDIEASCTTLGTVGNGWDIGRIKHLKSILNISHKLEVYNTDISSGGLTEEEDDAYRKRILAAPEAFSTCGSVAAYEYHVRAVSQAISDVNVVTPKGGLVRITVLTKDGVPDARLLNDIKNYVSGETLRPLCDTVEIIPAVKRDYRIVATLKLLEGYREDIVKSQAQTALQTFLSGKARRLGVDVVPSAIISALRVDGVYDVTLSSPAKMVIGVNEWANCTAMTINIDVERTDG